MNNNAWTKEDHDRLIRIDERTEYMMQKIEEMGSIVTRHSQQIDKLNMNASYNKGMLKATAAVASFVTSSIIGIVYILLKVVGGQ